MSSTGTTSRRPATRGPRSRVGAGSSIGSSAVVIAGVGALAVVTVVAAVAFTGAAAAPPAGIVDAGAAIRWALPVLRVIHDLAAALTVGSLLVVATLLPARTQRAVGLPGRANDARTQGLRLAAAAGFVWAVAGLAVVVLQFSDVSGLRLLDPVFGSQFVAVVWSLEFLRIGIIVSVLAAVVSTGAVFALGRWTFVWLLAICVIGLLTLGLAGHAGGSANHETAVNSLATHILAAALWVGGLLALLVLRRPIGAAFAAVARRYSSVALWCYVALAVSGVIAASTRLSGLGDLVGTRYGLVLTGKATLLLALGAAGWLHRQRTLDRLDENPRSSAPFLRLATAEVGLMAVAFGLGVALSRTAPPVPVVVADPSPALTLTGFPAPAAPTAQSLLTLWRVEWLFLATGLLAIGWYVHGVLRLHRRGDRWPVGRTSCWVVGWLLFLWATNGALGIYGRVSFSWHMSLHMLEAMIVPIFLVLGAPVSLALRTLPRRTDGSTGPREILLAVVHSSYLRVVGNPVFAGFFFFFSLLVFYWTNLFDLALVTHTGHLVMTAHFVLAGYFFAWVLIGVDPGPAKWSPAMRLVVLFATMAFHAFFGVALIGGDTLLGGEVFRQLDLSWVPDLLADQRTGGQVAWAVGEFPTLALALIVAVQWARSDKRESVRLDRQADRDGDAELEAYNARLAGMAKQDMRNQGQDQGTGP